MKDENKTKAQLIAELKRSGICCSKRKQPNTTTIDQAIRIAIARHDDLMECRLLYNDLQNENKARKKAEYQLQKHLDQLEETIKKRTDELQEKQAQLIHSERLSLLGEMTTGITHELMQPLTIIRAEAELIQLIMRDKKELSSILEDAPEQIMKQIDRSVQIMDGVRSFARKDIPHEGMIELIYTIEESLIFFNQQFKNRDITLVKEYEQDIPALNLHPQRFEQIVINFMSNARYAVVSRQEIMR